MSAKRIVFEFKDASGAPLAGANVKATDCWELQTNADGIAVFLIDVEDYSVTVNGKEAYTGKLSTSPEKIEVKA